jgi:hypothetical protein
MQPLLNIKSLMNYGWKIPNFLEKETQKRNVPVSTKVKH